MNIPKGLVELRKKSGFKQNEAAKKALISQTYLSQIESGAKEPSTEVLKSLCKVYNMPMAALMFKATEMDDIPKHKRKYWEVASPIVDALIDIIAQKETK